MGKSYVLAKESPLFSVLEGSMLVWGLDDG